MKRLFLITLPFVLVSALLYGQTSTPTPNPNQDLQDQKDRLSLQKDIEDLKTGISQDQVNRAKANIGTINTANLPSGNAQLTNVDIQPSIIGFAAMRATIGKVITDLYGNPVQCPDSLVFRSGNLDDVALLSTYRALLENASKQVTHYEIKPTEEEEKTRPRVAFAPAVAFAAIDAVVALGSLFKSDVTITGVTMTPDDEALRYSFVQLFSAQCGQATIIDPNSFGGPLAADPALLKQLADLNHHADTVQAVVLDVQTTDLPKFDKQIADLEKALKALDDVPAKIKQLQERAARATPADRQKIEKEIAELQKQLQGKDELQQKLQVAKTNSLKFKEYVSEATGVLTRVTALNTALNKTDDAGTPFLLRLLKAEALEGKVANKPVLLLSFVKIGGNNIVKKNAFHTSIKFGGGALIKFELRDSDGLKVLKAGEEDAYRLHGESDSLGSTSAR